MRTKLERRGFDLTAALVVQHGMHGAETIDILIPTTRRGSIDHIFKLPPDVCGLRWAPMKCEGLLTQSNILLSKIGKFEQTTRMLVSVFADLWKFRKTQQALRHGITPTRLVFDIVGTYKASSKLRFHYVAPTYQDFLISYADTNEANVSVIRRHIGSLTRFPLFATWSILDGLDDLSNVLRAIDSLKGQYYENWRFCIFIAGRLSSEVIDFLYVHFGNDTRITLRKSLSWPGDGTGFSLGPDMRGDFIVELDLNDQWAPQALYHVALEINQHPNVDVLYADEDCLSPSGQRRTPYFKCDWNPELFYSRNLIGNLAVYRRSVVEAAGGIGSKYPAARRLDLALRCVSQISPQNIRHLPFVLCHRGQSAEWEGQEAYVSDAAGADALAAMRSHFSSHSGVRVDAGPRRATFRVRYPLPDPPPLVSLLIPTRDALEVLQKCIKSVLAHTDYPNWEIIVLDNQTSDPAALRYLLEIAEDPRIRVVRYDLPFNYSAINNFGVGLARGEIIGLLNNDVEAIHADWLTEMVSHAVRPEIGAVGAKLLYSDGYVQHAGVVVGLGGLAGHVHRFIPRDHPGYAGLAQLTQAFSAVTAACLLVRREVYLAVGGLDEVHLTVAYNDVDLCLRIRDAGFRNVWTPHALLYHHESYSRGDDQESSVKRARFEMEKAYMLKRWHTDTVPDPFYSPNLTTDKEDYSIAHVPRVVKPWAAYLAPASVPKSGWRRFFRR